MDQGTGAATRVDNGLAKEYSESSSDSESFNPMEAIVEEHQIKQKLEKKRQLLVELSSMNIPSNRSDVYQSVSPM